ncbi:MAG: hypothetical protein Alpg2KO_33720 [Alphaproteobacteria bacterium]
MALKIALKYTRDGSDTAEDIGALLLDDAHMLTAEPAHPGAADYLRDLAEEINAWGCLHVNEAPPQAKPFESWARVIERGTDEFPKVLQDLLKRDYGFEVVSTEV